MPRSKNGDPSGLARRELVARGALSVLGGRGSRGLTHRAVDRALSLPSGSTSYYFNSRTSLLLAALDALFAADTDDVRRFAAADGRIDTDALLALWTSPAQRERLLARLELFLESARNEAVRAKLRSQRAQFIEASIASAAAKGATDPRRFASDTLARVESEMLRHAAFGQWD